MSTALEARVWLAVNGRFNPFQRCWEGVLRLDGDALTFHGDQGETLATTLSEARLAFPRSMTRMGFALTVGGRKAYVWFSDPFAGRTTMLGGGDADEANVANAKGWFTARKAAKPWLTALRASTG